LVAPNEGFSPPAHLVRTVPCGRPVIRIVDFESAYDVARHSNGDRYNPPTTAGFCAPEVVQRRAPDGRADVFSLGTVLYTLIRGYGWTWATELSSRIEADPVIDVDLRTILVTAVDRDADRRYQSIEEMSVPLAAYLEMIWPGRVWV
jgi:serine/threonine protein kinase